MRGRALPFVALALVATALARGVAADAPRPSAPDGGSAGSSDSGAPRGASTEVRMAPGPTGALGAWLVLGPFPSATANERPKPRGLEALTLPPKGLDEATLAPSLGAAPPGLVEPDAGPPRPGVQRREPVRWQLASSAEGPIDLKALLKPPPSSDPIAYAAGTLRLDRARRLHLLVGADDGVRVSVDGRVVLARDESRPYRPDDDLVTLDLAAGEHPILLKLHQRDGGWAFRVRLLGEDLAPPSGAELVLPGTSLADATQLAAKLSWVSLDRGLAGAGYRPRLTVRFPEGAPLGVPLPVRVRFGAPGAPGAFDVSAGDVPATVGELVTDLPRLEGADLRAIEGRNHVFTVEVAGRKLEPAFLPRRPLREVVARADKTLAAFAKGPRPPWLREDSLESLEHLRDRIASAISRGDPDLDPILADGRELDAGLDRLDRGLDPYVARTGAMRLAYRSPIDGGLQEYGLYVPTAYKPGGSRRFPLITVLHGLNGKTFATVRHLFGGDDPKHEGEWEDRRVQAFIDDEQLSLDAFVLAPSGHGNAMYRQLGQDDVMRTIRRVMARYPVDADRVTITGFSMGGIGAASIPLRNPDFFAAAMPLCGYHSYFVRRDFYGRPIRPWERSLAEERSNVFWAENGARLPLFVVHGLQDLPVENSDVLIKRYEELKFPIEHEHPNLGHNVWQPTYENLKGAKWLLKHRRDPHPSKIHFKTMRLRDGDDAWLHVKELADYGKWAELDARVRTRTFVELATKNVTELALDRDRALLDPTSATEVSIDGTRLRVPASDPILLHKTGTTWALGPLVRATPWKRGTVTGPLRDVFHEPILFVWGADDPAQARANEEVARAWAEIRPGTHVKYPILSDAEFVARGESLANDKALFLVGNAKSNRVLRALEADLPIRVEETAVTLGTQRFTGKQLGAAFIRPNPKRPDRYLVVVAGTDALGTWRSLSLPDLLPDFVVYDESVGPARGQMLLSGGRVLAGGFFENDWSVPAKTEDPFAKVARPAAETEHDATPYLP
jgi:predicted esterase